MQSDSNKSSSITTVTMPIMNMTILSMDMSTQERVMLQMHTSTRKDTLGTVRRMIVMMTAGDPPGTVKKDRIIVAELRDTTPTTSSSISTTRTPTTVNITNTLSIAMKQVAVTALITSTTMRRLDTAQQNSTKQITLL